MSVQELACRLLKKELDELHEAERRILTKMVKRMPVSRPVHAEMETARSFGDRVADRVAAFGGSWAFILMFSGVIFGWIVLNTVILARQGTQFDPYPFIMLNLVLSMVAAFQAPFIMMSQNRQSAQDRVMAAHDFEINLKAELEILSLHEKVDTLRSAQWRELIEMQQEQIRMLIEVAGKQQAVIAEGIKKD